MNILYIAYSCSPVYGSEDKIGWQIPWHSAKEKKVWVLTKEEHRKDIEKYLSINKNESIHFFYADIPVQYKKVFKGALYSGRLNLWNKYAYIIAEQICAQNKIDVIHQITPVEFRSIGDYGKIPNVKFVCGPIAGGQAVPKELKAYTASHKTIETVRTVLNSYVRMKHRIRRKYKECDYIFFANRETADYLYDSELKQDKWSILPDVSASKEEFSVKAKENLSKKTCVFLVVGRLVYLKGHAFLLEALAKIPDNFDFRCIIVGKGPEREHLEKQCKKTGLEQKVSFVGSVPWSQIGEYYENADVLIVPSLREATGTVIMEAMTKAMPVVTINKFGGAILLDESCAWLYDGVSREDYVDNLSQSIISCISHPEEVLQKGKNAQERARQYIWEKKVEVFQKVYRSLI